MVIPAMILLAGMTVPLGPVMAQEDTWTTKFPMPTGREKTGACAIDGDIYVIGGVINSVLLGLTTNEAYDTTTDSWTTRTPMPTARRRLTTTVVDGKCYAIGGHRASAADGLTDVEIYDPAADSWSTGTPMPTHRFAHTAAAVDGKIYVVGGKSTALTDVFGTLEIYDPVTDLWTTGSPMPTARGLLTASAVNGKVYAIGGSTEPGSTQFSTIEMYDPATDTWSARSPMPSARFALTSSTVNGRIYVIGGARFFNALGTVEEYDPLSDTWTARAVMPQRRHAMPSAVVDGRIYVMGGSNIIMNPHDAINILQVYTPPAGFRINAGHNDAWFFRDTAGQGFFIIVYPDLGLMFLSWFTFETSLPDDSIMANLGWAGHRWFTAVGPYSGDTAVLDIEFTSGGVFDSAEPKPDQVPDGGTVTVKFDDCENGTVSYDIPSIARMNDVPITRIVPDNVALCKELNTNQ
jgi:N-acetylneuraminic acid mutarotase